MTAATRYIYVLRCPLTGAIRYVGKCVNLKARLRQHVSEARTGASKSHKAAWIKSLLKQGQRPLMEVDVIVPPTACWKAVEIARIAHHSAAGADLTNATPGGDEPGVLTEEGRRRLSAAASAVFGSREGRQRQAETMTELCKDKEFVRLRSEAAKAARARPEYKAKASERSKARWADPAYRAKMAATRGAVYADPAYRLKLSQATVRTMSDPDARLAAADRARAAWANPEVRERQVAAIRAAASRKDAKS